MPSAGLSGIAVAITTAGGFLVYTGIKNVTVLDGLRQIMRGQAITEGAQTYLGVNGGPLSDGGGKLGTFGGPLKGSASPPAVNIPSSTPRGEIQAYAQQLLTQYGWGDQWNSFNALVMGESGWNPNIVNPTSGAYGIPQILPSSHGHPVALGDYQGQLKWMMEYIKNRPDYGSPNAAYAKWSSRSPHWY